MKGAAMSELEKTAPNEIYLIVGDTDKDCNFNELVEVTWADKPVYEETAIKYVKSPRLTIPKSIADELKEAIGATNFESTPYSIKLDEDEYLKIWASLRHKKLSDKAYKFCRDNTRVFDAYLNQLTRDLVKVVADE